MAKRPDLVRAQISFKQVYDDIGRTVSSVGTKIGGNVNYNINKLTPTQGKFENACAIRMSYVLNQNGIKIPFIPKNTVSGGKGDWYIFRVKRLIQFLHDTFGSPDITVNSPSRSDFASHKGILVFEVDEWVNAEGHATLWSGIHCSDSCYFTKAKKAHLWELK